MKYLRSLKISLRSPKRNLKKNLHTSISAVTWWHVYWFQTCQHRPCPSVLYLAYHYTYPTLVISTWTPFCSPSRNTDRPRQPAIIRLCLIPCSTLPPQAFPHWCTRRIENTGCLLPTATSLVLDRSFILSNVVVPLPIIYLLIWIPPIPLSHTATPGTSETDILSFKVPCLMNSVTTGRGPNCSIRLAINLSHTLM